MKNVYEILEFPLIQEELKTYCASSLGKKCIETMTMLDDEDDLRDIFCKVDEAMQLISLKGRLPLGGLSDIHFSLEKAKRDGTLMAEELFQVMRHEECVQGILHYTQSIDKPLVYLQDVIQGLVPHDSLYQEIKRCILENGEISDHASPLLNTIRQNIRHTQYSIRHKMESLVRESKDKLSIDSLSSKNNRLVLPVKAGYKNEFGGLIHAKSATGQTLYIEPEAVLTLNQSLNDLEIQENEEIQRILYTLSQRIKQYYYHYHFNLEIMEELDFLFSKAYYGYVHQCCIPLIQENQSDIVLKQARHPLIDAQKVVPNDIVLHDSRMLLITGSNTGGKTVTLKTVGLLSMMALCGIPVPCLEMEIPLFNHIYVDLGDEQSIEQSLSTFSGHMKKMIDILQQVTSKSLVLIDEIGSGTDPQEGESLAEAILMRFLEEKSYTFVTTHYGKLKTFAKENQHILLASVGFDVDNMLPTYHLSLGSAGQSYAIEIASILGMDASIIQNAITIKEQNMGDHEKLMETLEKKEEELRLKENELQSLIASNKKMNQKYQSQLKQLEHQKQQALDKAHQEANTLVREAKEQIQLILEDMKSQNLKPHEINQYRHDLDELTYHQEEPVIKQNHVLKKGDHVKVIKMNREGEIVDILNQHQVLVSINGLSVKLHEDDVVFMHEKTKIKKPKEKAKVVKKTSQSGHYELNIIGMRYEEAMGMVDKFLDNALVMGYPHVRIVHGMGTGVLRKGVRRLLEKNKHVVSYRDGGPNEGGLGATLVYFE